MPKRNQTKVQIHQHLIEVLNSKLTELKLSIKDLSDSIQGETKSSAGDKFETARETMQAELRNKQFILNETLKFKANLQQIDPTQKKTRVEFGSLVETNMGIYFISLALGKVTINQKDYYALSLASPIGQQLIDKETGDNCSFQNKTIEIRSII